jgi:ADP-heptose:LPS heptosyltransferase
MEYRYARMLGCMDPNKVDYYRAVQFEFLVNSRFKNPKDRNKYLDRYFFTDKAWKKRIEDFINEIKNGHDIVKARNFSMGVRQTC